MPTPPEGQAPGQAEQNNSVELLRKRKQLSSCDSCRARRIRCIRENNNEICVPCKEKNIRCTSNYIQSAPRLNSRNVKRIPAPSSSSSQHDQSDLQAISTPGTVTTRRPSDQSSQGCGPMDVAPVGSDISGPFGKHLIDTYYDVLHNQCPVIQWESFYQEAFIAGFSAAEMGSPEGQVMCLVVQAFGARVSDHPFILGQDAPRRDTLPRGANLAPYGRKRKIFCAALLERAMRAFHGKGISQRVNIRSISIMVVLFWLHENTNPGSPLEPRLFTSMTLEHMRYMLEHPVDYPAEDIAELKGGGIFWAIFVGEATASAHTGRQLQMSLSDIKFCSPSVLHHDLPLRSIPTTDPGHFLGVAAIRLFGDLAMIARTIVERLNGPLATQSQPQRIDPEVVQSLWEDFDIHTNMCIWVQGKMEGLFNEIPVEEGLWMKTIICASGGLVEIVNQFLQDALKRARVEGESYPRQIEHLTMMCVESKRRSLAAVMDLCATLQDGRKYARVIAFGGTLLGSLGSSILQLIAEPAYEEGGDENYTLFRKIGYVEALLDNLKFTAWAWETGNYIDIAEEKLALLKQMAAQVTALVPVSTPYSSGMGMEVVHYNSFDASSVPMMFPWFQSAYLNAYNEQQHYGEEPYRDSDYDVTMR